MNSGWKIGRMAGIGIYVHWTFLILPVWIAASALSGGLGVIAALTSVATVLAIFGCVVLHELGHALAARQFGVGTRDITLYPIGGVARLHRIPRNPWQELIIAIAGPAVNVALALLLGGLMLLSNAAPVATFDIFANSMLFNLLLANIIMVIFNMLPAFPMDGGRVLRAVLAMRMRYLRATQIASQVGKGMAWVFGGLGLVSFNLPLMFIAFFVYLAADQERRMVEASERPQTMPLVPEIVFHPTSRHPRAHG